MEWDKIIDLFNFKSVSKDYLGNEQPQITIGSIVWGTLFRSFIIITLSFLVFEYTDNYDNWWFALFVLWFFAAMPAYSAYTNFQKDIVDFSDSTLCGSCRNFDKSAQLCKIYDQHPTDDFIPCEGNDWEPKTYEDQF